MTYRITSPFIIVDPQSLLRMLFANYEGQPMRADLEKIEVTFETEQTPVDLGPFIKVERIDNPS